MSIGLRPDHRPPRRADRAVRGGAWWWALVWLCACASMAADPPRERAMAEPASATERREPATKQSPSAAHAETRPAAERPVEPSDEANAPALTSNGSSSRSDAPEAASPDSALSLAAFEGDLSRARELIQDGADLEARDRYGGTPLMAALRKFAMESKTTGPRAGPTERESQRAARKLQIARLLIERGANVRASDRLGHTPLHFAAMARGAEREVVAVLEALIARGAAVDQRTDEKYRRTPLEYAIDQGSVGRVECLLRHGADAGAVTAEGKSLHAIAEERGYAAIAEVLRAAAQR